METANVVENARTILGEDYPTILEMMENLLARPISAPELLDVLTPTILQAVTRERKLRARAAQARGIAEA